MMKTKRLREIKGVILEDVPEGDQNRGRSFAFVTFECVIVFNIVISRDRARGGATKV
jgi:hypothetical protein